jgi:hypothetical protein
LQAGQRAALGDALDEVTLVTEPEEALDFAIFFALNSEVLTATAPEIVAELVPDGLFWIAYPKRSSGVKTDLSRDVFWEILKVHGYRPVTQVYIDPVWTAMRFRHVDLIGKK